jgi:chromosome segregation ATPase
MGQTSGSGWTALGLVTVLLIGATGVTVFLGVRHQRMMAMNQELMARYETLQRDRDEKDRALAALAERGRADQTEIQRLREALKAGSDASVVLKQQLATLEKQAASLQEEIKAAQAAGTLKEARIAELTDRLSETKVQADQTASQLRALGHTKDELGDQVGKLQARLADSQSSLDNARRLNAQQMQTIALQEQQIRDAQQTAITLNGDNDRLREANADLQRDLSTRPKPSTFKEADIYRPSRDSKRAPK